MCRSEVDGGRRCPCDSSEARRLRRHNQQTITQFQNQLTQPVEKATPPATPLPAVPTREQVWNKIMEVSAIWQAAQDDPESMHSVTPALEAAEVATTELGAMLDALINDEAGLDLDTLHDEHEQRRMVVDQELVEAAAVEEKLESELLATYTGHPAAMSVFSPAFDLSDPTHQLQFKTQLEQNPSQVAPHSVTAVYQDAVTLGLARRRTRDAKQAVRELHDGQDETSQEVKERLIESTRNVLSGFVNLGKAEAVVAKGSDQEAAEALQDALNYYPMDWTLASNYHGTPMEVKMTTGRAHYREATTLTKQKTVVAQDDVFRPEGETPRDTYDQTFQKAEDGHREGQTRWIRTSYETYNQNLWADQVAEEDVEKPKGRGWMLVRRPTSRKTEDGGYEIADSWVWRRPLRRKESESYLAAPELLVSGTTEKEKRRVALHEFGHRMEGGNHQVGRRLRRLETAFYKRRTTSDDGTQQQVERMGAHYHMDEITRPDGFANRYMGKVYTNENFGGESDRNYELLSMGAEALFSGSHGAFVGLDGYKKDLDSRNFILGLWVSVS